MSSRADLRVPLRILVGVIVMSASPPLVGGVGALGDEPPGAPRMPAGGHSDPGAGPSTGKTPSPADAARDLIASAKAGDSEAQRKLGLALIAIKPPRTDEALRWLRQSADKGNAAAMTNVGQMFAAGLGVLKNEAEAAAWYRRAADKGDADGQNFLGQLYDNGRGVPQDFAEALKWYRLAVAQKNANAQNNLGVLHAKGRGVPLDQVEASRLYRLSADQGNGYAQLNLGFQYVNGHGVSQSNEAAYFWLNLAASRLPATAAALRDQVAKARDATAAKLGPTELQRLQQLAGTWKPGSADVPSGVDSAGAPGRVQAAGAVAPSAPGTSAPRGSGTGFVISQSGYVLTNNHVAGSCTEVHARHGADVLGTLPVVAKDAQNDLALLKLPSRFPDAAVFREDRGLRQGDSVVIYGFPLIGVLATQGNLTTGSISALSGMANDSRMLQVSAPVQPGNSGGPLLDGGGNVIGIVTGQLSAVRTVQVIGTVPQNVNFAIKAGVARGFLDANGVDYRTTNEPRELKTADVGDRAKKFTLYIECWR
jgi:hypothetical protein